MQAILAKHLMYDFKGKTYSASDILDAGVEDWKAVTRSTEAFGGTTPFSGPPPPNRERPTKSVVNVLINNEVLTTADGKRIPYNNLIRVMSREISVKSRDPPVVFIRADEGSDLGYDPSQGVQTIKMTDEDGNEVDAITVTPTYDKGSWADDGMDQVQYEIKFFAGIPDINHSNKPARYFPDYMVRPADTELEAIMRDMLSSGVKIRNRPKNMDATAMDEAFLQLYEELKEVNDTKVLTTGTLRGQLGRLANVHRVASMNRNIALQVDEYEKILNRLNPLKVAPVLLNNDHTDMIKLIKQFDEKFGIDAVTFNVTADGGISWVKEGAKVHKKKLIVLQSMILASRMMAAVGTKDWDLWQAIFLVIMKPKMEVYKREAMLNKTRNIMVYDTHVMLPLMALYNASHLDNTPWGEGGNIVISGFSPFKGKLGKLLSDMSKVAQDVGVAYAVYADNVYIMTHVNGKFNWYSLDGASMEASSHPNTAQYEIRRWMNSIKAAGGEVSGKFATFYLDVCPSLVTRPIGVIGDSQIQMQQLASGSVGTFQFNTSLMILAVDQLMKRSPALLFNEKGLTPDAIAVFTNVGIEIKVESVVLDLFKITDEEIPLDILGYSARCVKMGDKVVYAPVLNWVRLKQALVFPKAKLEKKTGTFWNMIVKYMRTSQMYVLGGWARPALAGLLVERQARLFKGIIKTMQHTEIPPSKFVEDITAILTAFSNDDDDDDLMADEFIAMIKTVLETGTVQLLPSPEKLGELIFGEGVLPYIAPRTGEIQLNPSDWEGMLTMVDEVAKYDQLLELISHVPPRVVNSSAALVTRPVDTVGNQTPAKTTERAEHYLKNFKSWMEKRIAEGIIIYLCPPAPVNKRGPQFESLPPGEAAAILWNNFARSLAMYFQVTIAEIKPYMHLIVKLFRVRYALGDIADQPDAGKYVNVTDATAKHKIWLPTYAPYPYRVETLDGSALAPRLDTQYYMNFFFEEESTVFYYLKEMKPMPTVVKANVGLQQVVTDRPVKPRPVATQQVNIKGVFLILFDKQRFGLWQPEDRKYTLLGASNVVPSRQALEDKVKEQIGIDLRGVKLDGPFKDVRTTTKGALVENEIYIYQGQPSPQIMAKVKYMPLPFPLEGPLAVEPFVNTIIRSLKKGVATAELFRKQTKKERKDKEKNVAAQKPGSAKKQGKEGEATSGSDSYDFPSIGGLTIIPDQPKGEWVAKGKPKVPDHKKVVVVDEKTTLPITNIRTAELTPFSDSSIEWTSVKRMRLGKKTMTMPRFEDDPLRRVEFNTLLKEAFNLPHRLGIAMSTYPRFVENVYGAVAPPDWLMDFFPDDDK